MATFTRQERIDQLLAAGIPRELAEAVIANDDAVETVRKGLTKSGEMLKRLRRIWERRVGDGGDHQG